MYRFASIRRRTGRLERIARQIQPLEPIAVPQRQRDATESLSVYVASREVQTSDMPGQVRGVPEGVSVEVVAADSQVREVRSGRERLSAVRIPLAR